MRDNPVRGRAEQQRPDTVRVGANIVQCGTGSEQAGTLQHHSLTCDPVPSIGPKRRQRGLRRLTGL